MKELFFYFIIFSFFSCKSINENRNNERTIIELFIAPVGKNNSAYYINIDSKGKVKIQKGSYNNESKSKFKLINVNDKAEFKLNDYDLNEIKKFIDMDMIENVKDKDNLEQDDGWEVLYKYNNNHKHFQCYYKRIKDNPVDKIIDIIKSQSVLKIDLHSWS